MKLLVIIPAFNEQDNILNTVNVVKKKKIKGIDIDYVVINDGSRDNTLEVLEKNNLNYIDLPFNLGIGGAVQTGYKYALDNDYDYALQFDGDGQHNIDYLEDLLKESKDNDMVIGSRFVGNLSAFKSTKMRRMGINFLSNLINTCTKKRIYDPTSGFRLVNKRTVEYFAHHYPVDYPEPDTIVTLLKKGYNIKEVAVEMNERKNGVSSISPLKSVYYMIKVSLSIIMASLSVGDKK